MQINKFSEGYQRTRISVLSIYPTITIRIRSTLKKNLFPSFAPRIGDIREEKMYCLKIYIFLLLVLVTGNGNNRFTYHRYRCLYIKWEEKTKKKNTKTSIFVWLRLFLANSRLSGSNVQYFSFIRVPLYISQFSTHSHILLNMHVPCVFTTSTVAMVVGLNSWAFVRFHHQTIKFGLRLNRNEFRPSVVHLNGKVCVCVCVFTK